MSNNDVAVISDDLDKQLTIHNKRQESVCNRKPGDKQNYRINIQGLAG